LAYHRQKTPTENWQLTCGACCGILSRASGGRNRRRNSRRARGRSAKQIIGLIDNHAAIIRVFTAGKDHGSAQKKSKGQQPFHIAQIIVFCRLRQVQAGRESTGKSSVIGFVLRSEMEQGGIRSATPIASRLIAVRSERMPAGAANCIEV